MLTPRLTLLDAQDHLMDVGADGAAPGEQDINQGFLPAGTYVIEVSGSKAYGDVGHYTLTGSYARPFTNALVNVPGTVEAENFDIGGEGISYHDSDAVHQGDNYRSDTAVDIGAGGSNGFNVGWTRAGEWLDYGINLTFSNPTQLFVDVKFANAGFGGHFHVEFDGGALSTKTVQAYDTGGWTNFRTMDLGGVTLTPGPHVMRLVMDDNGDNGGVANFDSITVRVDQAPITVRDNVTTETNTPVMFAPAVNDVDPDGYVQLGGVASQPAHGVASELGNSPWLIYTPNPGFSGVDSFTYTATDNDGRSATG
jgi:hypothetical protein